MTKVVRTAESQAANRKPARWKTVAEIRGQDTRQTARRQRAGQDGNFLRALLGVLWIIGGLVLTAMCVGVWYASRIFVEIMAEINERNFTQMSVQEEMYEEFFDSRAEQGFKVERDANRNFQGVITYMWRVRPPSSLETREFSWDYILEDTRLVPRTNGAVMLDVSLGYITESQAEELNLTTGEYNPHERIDRAIVYLDIGLKPMSDWVGDDPASDIMAPLISPQQGLARQSGFETELVEEEEAEAGEESGSDSSNSSSEVIDITSE